MTPPQNIMLARFRRRESPRREFTLVVVPGQEFHSGTKSRNGIMETRNDYPFWYEIGLPENWNWVAHA